MSKSNYPIKYLVIHFAVMDYNEQRLNIAEIDICADTSPYNDECEDSIIIGCTHLGIHTLYSLSN